MTKEKDYKSLKLGLYRQEIYETIVLSTGF